MLPSIRTTQVEIPYTQYTFEPAHPLVVSCYCSTEHFWRRPTTGYVGWRTWTFNCLFYQLPLVSFRIMVLSSRRTQSVLTRFWYRIIFYSFLPCCRRLCFMIYSFMKRQGTVLYGRIRVGVLHSTSWFDTLGGCIVSYAAMLYSPARYELIRNSRVCNEPQ